MKKLVIAAALAFAAAGCARTASIVKIEDVQVATANTRATAPQVRQAIMTAGTSLGWKIADAGPGKLQATLSLRTHAR